jgi:hypothetical protein
MQGQAALDGEVSRLNAVLAQKSRQLTDVYGSTSWKLTAPVRALGKAAARLRRSLRS